MDCQIDQEPAPVSQQQATERKAARSDQPSGKLELPSFLTQTLGGKRTKHTEYLNIAKILANHVPQGPPMQRYHQK
jgi:hypothetical protein